MLSRFGLVFFLSWFCSVAVLAHDDHGHEGEHEHDHDHGVIHDEAAFADYLQTVFLEVETDANKIDVDDRFIVFDNQGKPFYMSRNRLTQSLEKALIIYSQDHEHAICHGCSASLKARIKSLFSPITGLFAETGRFVRDPVSRSNLLAQVLARKSIQVRGDSARLMHEFGIIPMFVIASVAAITYPPYTAVTEVAESLFVGPAHVWCMFFQFAYIAGFKVFLNRFRSFRIWFAQVVIPDGHLNVFQRIAKAVKTKRVESRLKRQFKKVLLAGENNLVQKSQVRKQMIDAGSPLFDFAASSFLWAGGYAGMLGRNNVETPNEFTLEVLLQFGTEAQKVEYFLSSLEALELLTTLVGRQWLGALEDVSNDSQEKADFNRRYIQANRILGGVKAQLLNLKAETQLVVQTSMTADEIRTQAFNFNHEYQIMVNTLHQTLLGIHSPSALENTGGKIGLKPKNFVPTVSSCGDAFSR